MRCCILLVHVCARLNSLTDKPGKANRREAAPLAQERNAQAVDCGGDDTRCISDIPTAVSVVKSQTSL